MSSAPEVGLAEILKSADAGSAVIAAAGLAAASIWEIRTGRRQEVEVNVRAAVASLRSPRYMKLDGPAQRDPMDPLSGLYQVGAGRWVFVHCNFPNHRDQNLAVLGVAVPKKEDTAAAAAKWEGKALEDAFMTSGAAFSASATALLRRPAPTEGAPCVFACR